MTDAQTQQGWTPEKVERLKALLTEGFSASKAGDKLTVEGFGLTTRNAVIGKTHRMGIHKLLNVATVRHKSPTVPQKPMAKHRRPVHFGTGVVRAPTLRLAPVAPETFEPGPEGGVPFLELKYGQCKWALGGFDAHPEKFCGAKRVGGRPYCQVHTAIAYTKPRRNDGTQSKPFTFQPKSEAA